MTAPVTDIRLHDFLMRLKALYTSHDINAMFTAEPGSKFIKIIITNNQLCVYCFVEKATGNILKADGWKKPAKGVRGSIWNDSCDVGDGLPCDLFGGGLYRKI